jgi:hypothetical protein
VIKEKDRGRNTHGRRVRERGKGGILERAQRGREEKVL